MRHLIWDWNGTLVDDLAVVVDAVNVTLEELGAAPISASDYRDNYTRPVRVFYERILGRSVSDPDWRLLDDRFHAAYRERLDTAGLSAGAADTLRSVAEEGATQSVLSMWWHEELVPEVARLGVAPHMLLVEGNTTRAGEPKANLLAAHLGALEQRHGIAAPETVMIGDTLDDAMACAANAVACVLVDAGSHHRSELAASGYPVAADVRAAAVLALAALG